MKVFISWSGNASQAYAIELKTFLNKIFENIDFFVSSEDIDKSEKWNDELYKNMNDSKYSIICVTKFNLSSKWLNFEAGCLTRGNKEGNICPVLCGIQEDKFSGPLKLYQYITSVEKKEEVFKLIVSIKRCCNIDKTIKLFEKRFSKYWEAYKTKINYISDNPLEDLSVRNQNVFIENTLFISTPMSSLEQKDLIKNVKLIDGVISILKTKQKPFNKIICPAEKIDNPHNFLDKEQALAEDLNNLQKCEYFLFIYSSKTLTSAFVEIGYAISKGKKCVLIVKNRNNLPYLIQEADKGVSNFKIYECKDFLNMNKFMKSKLNSMFAFDRI